MSEKFPPEAVGPETEDGPELADQIAGAENFDELYAVLRNAGEIQGSQKKYPFSRLLEKIESAREIHRRVGGDPKVTMSDIIMRITNSEGLRDKVIELLEDDDAPTGKVQLER